MLISQQWLRLLLFIVFMCSGIFLSVSDIDASDIALEAIRLKAHQSNAKAQCDLGSRYRTGDGVPQDYGAAAIWYKKAAEQGAATDQYFLGRLYDDGKGVPQDYEEAFKWYQMAAEQGHVDAQGCLGSMYYSGQGIPQDFVRAYAWANLAATQGDPETIKMRDDLVKRMTRQQIAEAQKLSEQLRGKIQMVKD